MDDGHSNNYQKGAFILRDFKFSDGKLTSRYVCVYITIITTFNYNVCIVYCVYSAASTSGQFDTKEWLERVLLVGYPNKPTTVTLNDG